MLPIFRSAKQEDASTLDKINRICLPENYDQEHWRKVLERFGDLSYVALDSTVIIGYCLCLPHHAYTIKNPEAMIYSLAVLPNYRGKGIGKGLLLKSMLVCRKIDKSFTFYLNVRTSNKKAIELYKRFGFKTISIVVNYYKLPIEDSLYMRQGI
jgi:ribosomal-protein-alanine N-acetyltransferase